MLPLRSQRTSPVSGWLGTKTVPKRSPTGLALVRFVPRRSLPGAENP